MTNKRREGSAAKKKIMKPFFIALWADRETGKENYKKASILKKIKKIQSFNQKV